MTKRALDLVAAGCGLTLCAPLLIGSAVAIRVTMGSPVCFRQQRPGLGGKPFGLIKFRTMRPLRPEEIPIVSDGCRLTRLGAFLRNNSIDELPTLWNVIRGEMSIVGPRPLLMQYLGRYSPHQARRHEVKPGITGWAQIHGRNALSWNRKFDLDVWYVDHASLGLDLRILLATVSKVLARDGISHDGVATMPEFLGGDAEGSQ